MQDREYTHSHLAPEALTRGEHTPAGDAYMLGLACWEVFEGQPLPSAAPAPGCDGGGFALPGFTTRTDAPTRALIGALTADDPRARPTAAAAAAALTAMLSALEGAQ